MAVVPDDLQFKPPAIPMMRAGGIFLFTAFLQKAGSPVSRLLEKVGLTADLLEFPEEPVPMHQLSSFVDLAAQTECVEDLGALVGATASIDDLGDFGRLIRRQQMLIEIIRTAGENAQRYDSGCALWLEFEGHSAILCHRTTLPSGAGSHIPVLTVHRMMDMVRSVAPPGWKPQEILVQGRGANRKFVENAFDTNVRFDSSRSAIRFDPILLIAKAQRSSNTSTKVPASERFHRSAPPQDVVGATRQLIRLALRSGSANATEIAAAAGLTVRTLERYLSIEHASFSALLDDVRFDLAADMLRDVSLPIVDIAFAAGYGDAANFARAFRRWSGLSPRGFRQLAAAADDDSPKLS